MSYGLQQTRKIDDNALKNADRNAGEWLTYGQSYSEQRYSLLKQIGRNQCCPPCTGVVV